MALLADGIELPIVAAWGLGILIPLTLIVTTIECGVMRAVLSVPLRRTFRRVLVANVVSIPLGGVVSFFDLAVFEQTGILDSIPKFLSGYLWACLIMIGLYFVESSLVEGLIVASAKFSAAIGRRRGSVFKALVLGNVASYCLVGPLYYFATRPTLGAVEATMDTSWTANASLPVYFIDRSDRFIKRVMADGSDRATVVPYPAAAFSMSGDGEAFVYRGTDGNLYVYRLGDASPVRVWETEERFQMHSVSLAPDKTRVVFARKPSAHADDWDPYRLTVFDIDTGTSSDVIEGRQEDGWDEPVVSWSADGQRIFVWEGGNNTVVYQGDAPWSLLDRRRAQGPGQSELAENHVRSSTGRYGAADDWGVWLFEDARNGYRIVCLPGLRGSVAVRHNKQTVLQIDCGHGLLKIAPSWPVAPTFLPEGTEALLEWWDQLYILDAANGRLGLVTDGCRYIVPTPRFTPMFTRELPQQQRSQQ